MTKPLVVDQSRTIPLSQKDVFRDMVPMPLPQLFRRWYGPIPPIKEVRGQTGDWDSVGHSRTVVLVGGGSMLEQLTQFDPPHSFGYTLSDIKGPLSPLVGRVDGVWMFEPFGSGTNVTWRWTIHPRSGLTAPLLPVFGKLWKGYARQSLEELSKQLVH
ncbi:MAG TPA: SRPBCC family protein [Mycobacterium sp.]|nr:SRPBCC family protein [Mycobacterium sp.]